MVGDFELQRQVICALNTVLYEQLNYTGNECDFYNPLNSYIHQVRRCIQYNWPACVPVALLPSQFVLPVRGFLQMTMSVWAQKIYFLSIQYVHIVASPVF